VDVKPCGVAFCSSPTGARLCRTHKDQLRDVLRDLAGRGDGGGLALPIEVELTVTRQARTGGAVTGSRGGGEQERPLMFVERAADVLRDLREVVYRWSAEVVTANPHLRLRPADAGRGADVAETAGAVLNVLGLLSALDEAPRALRELSAVAREAERVIDRRGDRVYLGICSATCEDGECQEELYALEDADEITCRGCGNRWGVWERREWLRAALEETEASARDIAAGAGEIAGVVLNTKTIRAWAAKGLIETVGHDDEGIPLHRVGEVLEYAEGVEERKRNRGFLRGLAQTAESA